MAVPDSICTVKAVAVGQDSNIYEPHLAASTTAHMLGHNLGMGHDKFSEKNECNCSDWWGCVMSKNILGINRIQPFHFSHCSINNYNNYLQVGKALCLLNKPNQLDDFRFCGNERIDEGEQCDCGSFQKCLETDPCCDPMTCRLHIEAECSTGPCCVNCKLKKSGHVCRSAVDECDIPEVCDGINGKCPPDEYKKNGVKCKKDEGFCYNGECPTADNQCAMIWGPGSKASEEICFNQFNVQGNLRGNCGTDFDGNPIKCAKENVKCGTLQCQFGKQVPFYKGMHQEYSRIAVFTEKIEYECKVARGSIRSDIADMGLSRDGTKCSADKICINQTCVNVDSFIESGDCPSNHKEVSCSGNGICSNKNICHCYHGWTGEDCSEKIIFDSFNPTDSYTSVPETGVDTKAIMDNTTKLIEYTNVKKSLSAPNLVMILVSVVGCVFIFFTLLATCYRRQSLLPNKTEANCQKKLLTRKLIQTHHGSSKESEASHENVSRITFGSMPSYREDKIQELRRHKDTLRKSSKESIVDLARDDEIDENTTFFELSTNNLSKVPHHHPEKGILKHPFGLNSSGVSSTEQTSIPHVTKDKRWSTCEDDDTRKQSLSDMERSLKNINGYHEEILEALQTASAISDTRQSPAEVKKSYSEQLIDYAGTSGVLEGSQTHLNNEPEDNIMSCGPIRFRNLEDLLRQLEQQQQQHDQTSSQQQQIHSSLLSSISPTGSEVRLSEPEADRHLYNTSNSLASSTSTHISQPYSRHTSHLSSNQSIENKSDAEQRLHQILGYIHIDIPPPPPPVSSRNLAAPSSSLTSSTIAQLNNLVPPLIPQGASSSTTTSTSTVLGGAEGEDELEEYDENGSALDTDNGEHELYSSPQQLLRSASNETLPCLQIAPGLPFQQQLTTQQIRQIIRHHQAQQRHQQSNYCTLPRRSHQERDRIQDRPQERASERPSRQQSRQRSQSQRVYRQHDL